MIICRRVLDVEYAFRDSYIICSEEYYTDFVFPLNLAIFLSMSIVIPFFLIVKLWKMNKKKELRKVNSRRIFGYFYNEMKIDKYYWDFILMSAVI